MTMTDGSFLGIPASLNWLLMLAVALILTGIVRVVLRFLKSRLSRLAQKTEGKLDDIVVACLCATKSWAVFFWILTPLAQTFDLTPHTVQVIKALTVVATSAQVALWGFSAIHGWKNDFLVPRISKDASSASALNLLATGVKGLFVVALVLICLSNLGIDIQALVAGLGVGGIAVALAAQNILGDLFASLSIVLDKPFVIGDYIVVGSDQGTVENIGIKTTRVRSLSGEELIFANKDLLESRIKNFKRMWERRVVLGFGVPLETELDKLSVVPKWISGFVGEEPLLRFERAHLSAIGKASLDFEAVYWVKDADFNKFMDLQQALLMKLLRKFDEASLTFARPLQIIQVQAGEKTAKTEGAAHDTLTPG